MLHALTWLFMCFFACFKLSFPKEGTQTDFAVKIKGGNDVAKQIANELDFRYLGPVGNLEDIFHFQKVHSPRSRSKRSLESQMQSLHSHELVEWINQQQTLTRTKRDFMKMKENYKIEKHLHRVSRMFNDPRWIEEWYLYDTEKSDMRVIPVWNMNITGRNVKVTIIDDGLEHTHPDVHDNYDPLCSIDLNDNDDDPMPNTKPGTSNEHGTRCASEVAMIANNGICGVGIAYNSKIGGIRLLDGAVNDILEAKSIGFNNNHIDIYSASWGPMDDGKTMEKPGILAQLALAKAATFGRHGKGSIFVWASGNGGYYNDSCSCDGYVSSLYTISVSSITPDNQVPEFSELCAATMCATYSSSVNFKRRLVSADIRGECTDELSGTSASAPLAAGIFALALEANPNLTWRDIKHLVAWTSQYHSHKHLTGWKQNARGFWVNQKVGFGLLDAHNMVKQAKSWKSVPSMKKCDITTRLWEELSDKISKSIVIDGSKCADKITFIENIMVEATILYSKRGALKIILLSPNGMNTTLLHTRPYDNNVEGLKGWPLNTVHNWGESPQGKWTVFVEDQRNDGEKRQGIILKLDFTFYGTSELPEHVKNSKGGQRRYYAY